MSGCTRRTFRMPAGISAMVGAVFVGCGRKGPESAAATPYSEIITGRVEDAVANSLPGATVTVYQISVGGKATLLGETTTDSEGRFEMEYDATKGNEGGFDVAHEGFVEWR